MYDLTNSPSRSPSSIWRPAETRSWWRQRMIPLTSYTVWVMFWLTIINSLAPKIPDPKRLRSRWLCGSGQRLFWKRDLFRVLDYLDLFVWSMGLYFWWGLFACCFWKYELNALNFFSADATSRDWSRCLTLTEIAVELPTYACSSSKPNTSKLTGVFTAQAPYSMLLFSPPPAPVEARLVMDYHFFVETFVTNT